MRKLRGVLRGLAAAAAAGFGCLAYTYLTLPDVRPLAKKNPPTSAFIELRAREARAAGKAPRRVQHWVGYGRISPSLKRAVLVAEDAAFWAHEGVDYHELQRSIELGWTSGQPVRGASTITQQLAKNLYLSPSRNPLRKFRELMIARRLEAELKKARIFELYLNVIEWGDGVYGVEAAARTYFGTSAAALGPVQSALLAGAIINPRLLNPAQPTRRLLARQRLILRRMGGVTPPADTAAEAAPLAEPLLPEETAALPGPAELGAAIGTPEPPPRTQQESPDELDKLEELEGIRELQDNEPKDPL